MFYAKNIAALKTHHPRLVKRLESITEARVELTPAANGEPRVAYQFHNKWHWLSASETPLQTAFQQLKLTEKYVQIAIFCGFGCGYEIFSFWKHRPPENKYVLIIERDLALFKKILHHFDYAELWQNKQIELLIGIPEDQLYSRIYHYFIREDDKKVRIKATVLFEQSTLVKLHYHYYRFVMEQFKLAVREVLLFYGNSPADSLMGLQNILQNLGNIIQNPGIHQLENRFAKQPALLISAGPSLDRSLPQIKKIADQCLLFAVDAVLLKLLSKGIEPDFVFSHERNDKVEQFYRNTQAWNGQVYPVLCPVVQPSVFAHAPKPAFILFRNFAHFEWLQLNKGTLATGPSVANMAFQTAVYCGCDPIILIGQDLCYGENGASHAADIPFQFQATQKHRHGVNVRLPGNHQPYVESNTVWRTFLKHFELDIEHYRGQCLNATEGGARIQGAQSCSLLDCLANKPILTEKQRDKSFSLSINNHVETLERILTKTEKYCSILLTHLQTNEQKCWQANSQAELTFLLQQKREIVSGNELFYLFLMHIVQSFLLQWEIQWNALPGKFQADALLQAQKNHLQRWFAMMHGLVTEAKSYLQYGFTSLEELKRMDS